MPRLSRVLASLAIAAILYFSLIAGVDGNRVSRAMAELDAIGWLMILGLSLINYALRFARWHGYIGWLGHRVPASRHLVIYLAGFALTTTPGKAGEGLRAVYLSRLGVPYAHSVAAMFTERLLDLLAIAALSMLAILSFTSYAAWIVLPLAGLFGLLFMVHNRRWLERAHQWVGQPDSLFRRLAALVVNAWEQAFALLAWKPLLGGLAIGIVAWAAEGLSVYIIAARLGLPIALSLAIGIYAISMLIGALSFVPGGLGSTEAAMTLLLKLTGMAGTAALSVVLIARIATLWFAVVLGLCCLLFLELAHRWRNARLRQRPTT